MADLPAEGRAAKLRRDAADRRDRNAGARLAAADQGDAADGAHGAPRVVRDEVAAARNRAAAQRIAASFRDRSGTMSASERIIRAAGARKRIEQAEAAAQGGFAGRDRRVAAQDGERAAGERLHALVGRELLADALADAEVDPLTGARTRTAGLADLDRELLCCHRTSRSLVIAYVDVIGLETLNETVGYGAGDELLMGVVALLKQNLRSSDPITRLGGDEFLCTMTGVALPEVRRRFIRIAGRLAAGSGAGTIRTGFAELAPGDTRAGLIARAHGR